MLSILPIIITLLLLVFLAYKRINIVFVAVIATIILAIMTGQPVLGLLKTSYMESTAGYVKNFFLLFTISATFGKLMEDTGAASSIAKFLALKLGQKYAILGVVFSGAILCYGGVSSLVVIFSLYPIALSLFQKSDLPRYLIPGAMAAGCWTFASAHFPGTPQTVNVIPIPYLGTDTMAGAGIGVIMGIFSAILISVYLVYSAKKAKEKGDKFIVDDVVLRELEVAEEKGSNVKPILAILPIISVIIVLNVLKFDVLVSMLVGTIVCILLFRKNIKNFYEVMNYAGKNAALAAINTGVIVGYGSAVQGSLGFANLVNYMTSLDINPLISWGLTTTILSGAAGSGTGGLTITMNALAEQYLALGIPPQVLHRIGTAAAVGLDSLPHCGAIVTMLTVTNLTHKDSYKYIFVTTVVITLLTMFLGIILAGLFYL